MFSDQELHLYHPETYRLTELNPEEIRLTGKPPEPEYRDEHGDIYRLTDLETREENILERLLEEKPGYIALLEGPVKDEVDRRVEGNNLLARLQYGETVLEKLEDTELSSYLSETRLDETLVVTGDHRETYNSYLISSQEEPSLDLKLERNQGFTRTASD